MDYIAYITSICWLKRVWTLFRQVFGCLLAQTLEMFWHHISGVIYIQSLFKKRDIFQTDNQALVSILITLHRKTNVLWYSSGILRSWPWNNIHVLFRSEHIPVSIMSYLTICLPFNSRSFITLSMHYNVPTLFLSYPSPPHTCLYFRVETQSLVHYLQIYQTAHINL